GSCRSAAVFEQLLQKRLARAAAGAGFRASSDSADRGLAGVDGLEDRSFGHLMAVADLSVVGEREHGVFCRQFVPQEVERGCLQLVLLLERTSQATARVRRAKQDRADEFAIPDNELLVDAARGVEMADHFGLAVAHMHVAERQEIDVEHFKRGGETRTRVDGGGASIAEQVGENAGLIVSWIDQSIHFAAVLGAFADRKNSVIIRAELIIDNDAALNPQ